MASTRLFYIYFVVITYFWTWKELKEILQESSDCELTSKLFRISKFLDNFQELFYCYILFGFYCAMDKSKWTDLLRDDSGK